MKPPRTTRPLPRYVRRKSLANGAWGHFFQPSTWAKRAGCTVQAEAIGTDYEVARRRAEDILLPAFDCWRTGGRSDMVPTGKSIGTFDWLATIFKDHRAYKDEIDRSTRRMYDQGLDLVADFMLEDGSRVGDNRLADFSRGFVDRMYAALLTVEDHDDDGNAFRRTRRRFINGAMTACRRAWFVGQRAEERIVPAVNPFAKMGLKKRGPGETPHETPTATWDDLTQLAQLGGVLVILRGVGRHRSARQLPTYAKRTRKQLVTVAQRRRETRTAGNETR
jgi:hypothetical protein